MAGLRLLVGPGRARVGLGARRLVAPPPSHGASPTSSQTCAPTASDHESDDGPIAVPPQSTPTSGSLGNASPPASLVRAGVLLPVSAGQARPPRRPLSAHLATFKHLLIHHPSLQRPHIQSSAGCARPPRFQPSQPAGPAAVAGRGRPRPPPRAAASIVRW